MARIKESIYIDAPVKKVHEVADDPTTWSTWYAGLGEAERIEGDKGPGTVVEQSYLLAGVHLPVTTKVTENCEDPDGSCHWKSVFEGPLSGWQNWDYEPSNGGTKVTAEIEYSVPASVLGKVADRLFIERMQERATRQTLQSLKQLIEA